MKLFHFSAADNARTEKRLMLYIAPPVLAATVLFFYFSDGKDDAETRGGYSIPVDEAAQRMPDGASDVKYYFSPTFTAFEFNTDEPTFKNWAAAWSPREIAAPVKIKRHNYMGDAADQSAGPDETVIVSGLTAGAMKPDGTGEMAVFDRTARRAYYLNIP